MGLVPPPPRRGSDHRADEVLLRPVLQMSASSVVAPSISGASATAAMMAAPAAPALMICFRLCRVMPPMATTGWRTARQIFAKPSQLEFS